MDYAVCKGYPDQVSCEEADCAWNDKSPPPGAGKCVLDICLTNVTDDDRVTTQDYGVLKAEFGRGGCPATPDVPAPAPVHKTWQTTSYAFGDDGYYQKGIEVRWASPRFRDNEDGTVTDRLTGLIWLKNAGCIGQTRWEWGLSDCYNLNDPECGLSDGSEIGDWRMPNIKELMSLIDYDCEDPHNCIPVGHPFSNIGSNPYWTSTTVPPPETARAYTLHMGIGLTIRYLKTDPYYHIWPVKGGID
jgi:hypothetical protein